MYLWKFVNRQIFFPCPFPFIDKRRDYLVTLVCRICLEMARILLTRFMMLLSDLQATLMCRYYIHVLMYYNMLFKNSKNQNTLFRSHGEQCNDALSGFTQQLLSLIIWFAGNTSWLWKWFWNRDRYSCKLWIVCPVPKLAYYVKFIFINSLTSLWNAEVGYIYIYIWFCQQLDCI